MGQPPRTDRRAWAALGALLVVGALLRLGAIFTVGDLATMHGDEVNYVSAARSLAIGAGYPDSMRPPAFPFFVSLVLTLSGGSLNAVRVAQVPISLIVVAVVFDLVRRRYGVRAAFLSGLLCAVHPTLIQYTHFLWAEGLFTSLLLVFFWLLMRFDESRRGSWLIAAGVVAGLAALTREMVLYFLPLVVLWLWLGARADWRTRARQLALLVAPMALLVLPWTVRNYRVHHRFLLLSTARWLAMAEGNLLPDHDWVVSTGEQEELHRRYFAIDDEFQRENYARDAALAAIARQQPLWILKKMVRSTYLLFTSESQLGRFADKGWLAPGTLPLARPMIQVELVFYVLQLSIGLLALWLVPGGRLKLIAAGYILFSLAMYIVAMALHRYRVPLLPLFALFSGPLLCGHVARDEKLRWRILGAGACLVAFVLVLVGDAVLRP